MEVKKKYMSKDNWNRVIKRKYAYQELMEKDIKGEASLIYIQEVTSPSFKEYEGKSIKIADKGFYWLQIGMEDKNYWITAMYNEKKELIQYYFDITAKNIICYQGRSYFYDLFLDIVLLNNNQLFILDKEEIEKALEDKVISKEQYELAYKEVDYLTKSLFQNKDKLDTLCKKYFYLLNEKIKE